MGSHHHLDKYRRYAEKVRIFQGLTPEEVEYVIHHGKVLRYLEGQTIFHQGQLGNHLFVVLHGKVGIYDRDRQVAQLHVGDAFGEMAVLNHKPRSASALAASECKLLTLSEREINTILEKHLAVRILLNIIHVMSERLENANAVVTAMQHSETQ